MSKSAINIKGRGLTISGFLDTKNITIETEDFVKPVNIMEVAEKVGLDDKFCYITSKETDLEISEDDLDKMESEDEE